MRDSLVLELQRLAQASDTDLPELLRRAKVVATKLGQDDALLWIDQEINGYHSEVPPYRVVPSELRVHNPYHGWNAVAWGEGGHAQEHFATAKLQMPISQVEAAIKDDGDIAVQITQPEMDVLLLLNPDFARLPSRRYMGRGSFVGILECVRAKILDWSLALEKKGVLGEGMTFNEAEKRGAAEVVFRLDDATTVVLFLSANPDPASPLNVEKEQNRITKVRNGSKYQEKVRIEGLPDLDLPELAKSLRLHAPTVVHFSGHGGNDGSILMRDENGEPSDMNPHGLAKLFSLHTGTVRIVVLNACYSTMLADLLVNDIDCVVGMEGEVSDDAAVLFAQTFYGALLDGCSVEDSFSTSSAAVQARYPDEAKTPTLKSKVGVVLAELHLIN